jgi:hypothetical protein
VRYVPHVKVAKTKPLYLKSTTERFEDICLLALAYRAIHLRIALEASAHIHREEQNHMRRFQERLIQYLLVVTLCGPDIVLHRKDNVLVVVALDYKITCSRVAVDLGLRWMEAWCACAASDGLRWRRDVLETGTRSSFLALELWRPRSRLRPTRHSEDGGLLDIIVIAPVAIGL